MTTTAHLAFTLIETAQAQKEVTANAAFSAIDAVLNTGAKDKDLATPPGSPAEGDVYIIASSPTGAWSGQVGKIGYYNSGWKFITPREGVTLWVNDENIHYSYDGAAWVQAVGAATLNMQDNVLQRPELKDWCETFQGVTASATTVIDIVNGNVIDLTHGTNITTFTWSNPSPTGKACTMTIIRKKDNSGTTRTIAWPASVKWPAATAPTLTQTANAVDIFRFVTTDAGATWYGRTLGLNFS